MNKDLIRILHITVAELNFSFPVEIVDRVLQAQEISPSDTNEGIMKGLINLHGEIIPVISLRRRFSLPELDITPDNLLVILSFRNIKVAIIADTALGVTEIKREEIKRCKEILPGMSELEIFTRPDGIYYIYDAETLLSQEEEENVRNHYTYEHRE
jgi:purine-binding chemotaxis protein CheW